MRKDVKAPQHHQVVSFNDFMHEEENDEEVIENPLQKRSIRDMFDQEVFAGSKNGEDINSGMSLAQSSLMILGNKFKNNKKAAVDKRKLNLKDNGLLTSNGIDCNAESQRSIGLIGSGAYHHYRGENNDANSFKFGAFSAFSALRASPLKESYKESRYSSSQGNQNEIRINEINGSEIENSLCSNNGLKLQHELFFENQKNAMKQLMHGLLTQPQKLARVQESSGEVSTGHSYIDQSIAQHHTSQTMPDEENFSQKPKLNQYKDKTNLKIEELSNSKISFHDEPTITHRDSRWQTNHSKMYSVASSQAIPEENFQSLQGLMSEKEKANLEIEKINRNQSLTPLDRQKAIRSVKSLTRTIDDLIFREKDKISDHYESQLYSQIRFANQQSQIPQPDLACSDLFGLDKSKQDSVQESGSFLKSIDASEQDIMQAREMAADELEQRPFSKDVRSNAWKERLTKLPENKFGFQSSSLKIEDVNGSFNSLASSQNENGNQLKKSQILNKKHPVPRLPNFAQTLPSSISNAGYNTEKNPYHGRKSVHSEATQDVEGKTRKKNNNFWSEEIAETEREDESQQDYTKDLHSSSLQNNKNNSIADIIMTTPSFDPGSKVSAAFHNTSSQENSGILLKNFSLGAATQLEESVSLMLSPSQQSQPYHLTNHHSNSIKPFNSNDQNQLEQKLINMQQHLLKYNQVLQDMETMFTVQQQLEQEIKAKNDKITLFETNLKQADDIIVQHQVKEVQIIQQNTKIFTENQLLRQQLQHLERNQDLDHDQSQEVEQHYMQQLELQGRALQDYSQQIEMYKVAQVQSDQMLMHLENESQDRIQEAERNKLEFANKLKYIESLLEQQQLQLTNEAGKRIGGLEEKVKDMEREAEYQNKQNNQLQIEVAKLQTENDQMANRLDKTLQMTQKDRVQQTVTQMDLDSYISQIQRLKKSEEQLKTKLKNQQLSQNSQTKEVAEINSKYAIELEKNRALESQVVEFQNQLAQSMNEATQFKQTLKVTNTSLNKIKIGEKEKDDQLRDLKESIRIKMSVADDLQGLLKQSRASVEEYRMSQKEVLSERDNIMNQLWQSQHEVKDLSSKNEMLVHELESIIDESDVQSFKDQNPFLTRIKSVLTTSTANGKRCGSKRIESIQRNTFESGQSSVGDAELERAMNFQAQQTTREDDQMVPERDSSKTEVSDNNEEYFNQWVNTFK